MHLSQYSGKRVLLVDADGDKFEGIADLYTSALDNPNGVASITIRQANNRGVLLEFEEPEIASIEILASPKQKMAVAV